MAITPWFTLMLKMERSFEDVIKNDNTKFELDDDGRLRRLLDGSLLWGEVEEYSKT